MAYFPQELKRGDYRSFPVLTGLLKKEKEPVQGIFARRVLTPYSINNRDDGSKALATFFSNLIIQ